MTEVFEIEIGKFLITFSTSGYEGLNTSFCKNGRPNLGNVYLLCIYVKPVNIVFFSINQCTKYRRSDW